MNRFWIPALCVLLSACSHDTTRVFMENLLLSRSPVEFVPNAIRRPIFDCKTSPDPRYPCQGVGPEGFVRDLVITPFANIMDAEIVDYDKNRTYRVGWTWFSMVGTCRMSERAEFFGGRLFSVDRNKERRDWGLTFKSAEAIRDAKVAKFGQNGSYRIGWPPQPLCSTDSVDMAAGSPFHAFLYFFAPEAADRARVGNEARLKRPKHSDFAVGCRREERKGLTWVVCSGAGQERPGGAHGFRETLLERRTAYLGDSGFLIELIAHYEEPLYLFPIWYAERRAAIDAVIDSIHFETLPYIVPHVIPETPSPTPK
ncbi:MAG: hypothetical protein LBM17_06630 [Candidatus Accumulibacter sp.]|jgi:hypothetical protein|nr:hypothetical protein [Accumulibacter sp.]